MGGSSGSWKHSPFSILSDDARVGVPFLKHHPSVNAIRIGAWGGSEGGVIAPWFASRSPEVTFVILQAATGVTLARQNRFPNELLIRAHTEAEDEFAQGLRIIDLQARHARTGQGWQAHADARAAFHGRPRGCAGCGDPSRQLAMATVSDQARSRSGTDARAGAGAGVLCLERTRPAGAGRGESGGDRGCPGPWHRNVTCIVYPGADHSIQTENAWHELAPDRDYRNDLTIWVRIRTERKR